MELHISIFYIDSRGKIIGHFVFEKQSATRLLRQSEIFRDVNRQLELSREIISEKISNQRALPKRYEKTGDAEKLSALKTLEELRGTDARIVFFHANPSLTVSF